MENDIVQVDMIPDASIRIVESEEFVLRNYLVAVLRADGGSCVVYVESDIIPSSAITCILVAMKNAGASVLAKALAQLNLISFFYNFDNIQFHIFSISIIFISCHFLFFLIIYGEFESELNSSGDAANRSAKF